MELLPPAHFGIEMEKNQNSFFELDHVTIFEVIINFHSFSAFGDVLQKKKVKVTYY